MSHNSGVTYGFIGSGGFAARCLELLTRWQVPSWLVTAPARPAGRGKKPTQTPFADMADKLGLLPGVPLLSSASASRDEAVLRLKKDIPVTFVFVTDFGQLIREPLLAWDEPIGCLNIHPSLLPLYRGAAPIQRALMDGASESGVTLFKLASAMDAGPILLRRAFGIKSNDNAGDLLERAAIAGTEAFIEHAGRTAPDDWRFEPQDELNATTAPKISRDEERIDWSVSSSSLHNKIRALAPKPGAWAMLRDKRVRILKSSCEVSGDSGEAPGTIVGISESEPLVATGHGLLRLSHVQTEGKRAQPASEWWNGLRAAIGECFS